MEAQSALLLFRPMATDAPGIQEWFNAIEKVPVRWVIASNDSTGTEKKDQECGLCHLNAFQDAVPLHIANHALPEALTQFGSLEKPFGLSATLVSAII